jgi:rSAM/selenodomain-associated transferase 1
MTYPILSRSRRPSESAEQIAARQGLCALVVMAKAPRAGQVKTRLSPPLSPAEAAALNICFLQDTAENIAAAADSGVRHAAGLVAYTPAGDAAAFDGLLPSAFALLPQRGDSFGERLLFAAQDILALGFASVCLIDSDSPTLPRAVLQQAVRELDRSGDRLVLGPAEDGGYYLIGLKHPHPEPFERIAWSTAAVFHQTCQRARAASLEIVELPRWYDVDDAATLALLESELLEGVRPAFAQLDGYAAPHTRGFLAAREALAAATEALR